MKTVSKAKRSLQFVMRNLKGGDPQTKEHAYKCLIRPLLEYCCGVWDPHTAIMKEQIDQVQRKAARYVVNNHRRWSKNKNRPHVSVSEELKKLRWEPLSTRRARVALRCLYKAVTCEPAWECLDPFISLASRIGRRDHHFKLEIKRYNTNVGLQSFLGRSVRLWNDIPLKNTKTLPCYLEFNRIMSDLIN